MLLPLFVLNSCGSKAKKAPDVSEVAIKPEFFRLENDLFLMPPNRPVQAHYEQLHQSYGDFLDAYAAGVMDWWTPLEELDTASIRAFISFPFARLTFDATRKKFGDFGTYKDEITAVLKYYRHYFPKATLPKTATWISMFSNEQVSRYIDSKNTPWIAVSLEMFMGDTFRLYKALNEFPEFLYAYTRPEQIRVRYAEALGRNVMEKVQVGNRMLDEMIFSGKLLYFIEKMLPDAPDELLMAYSKDELKFCTEEESNIWKHYIKAKVLFDQDFNHFKRYFTEGLHTFGSGVPTDCPPRIGKWSGWQVVRKYMEKNPAVTLEQLLAEKDSDKILRESGYKPE